MKLRDLALAGAFAALLTACNAPGKVAYLQQAETIPAEVLNQKQPITDPTLGPGDLLNIRVYSSDAAAVAPFNRGQYLTADGTIATEYNSTMNQEGEKSTNYYLVNPEGNIDFPLIGTIHVGGKTKQQLAEEIRSEIYPKYVKNAPTVEIRLMNFKVTVLGSVNNPGEIVSDNERMNILQAIARAGDLTITGNRDNVLLVRTNVDGTREIHRLALNDSNLLLSPYFNLQQNDFIYVEPNRSAKQGSWQLHQGWTTSLAIISGTSSIAALVVGIINLTDKDDK